MRITSAGNVGIGTSSPSALLNLSSSSNTILRLDDTNGTDSYHHIETSGTNGQNLIISADQGGTGGGALVIRNNGGTEAMRVDSSGNLLVGKTSSAFTVAGHAINSDGLLVSTRDGDNVAVLNRETNDGSILQFRKDNSPVGSIGSRAGTVLYITSTGTNETGLDFGGISINPMLSGSLSNGTTDLGNAGNRFKDLYLSGGAYLGGTAAANKLDDYEEGTFTPELADAASGGNTATTTTSTGVYTKVGNLVILNMRFTDIDTTGLTGTNTLFVRDLPFTNASLAQNQCEGPVRMDLVDVPTGTYSATFATVANNTYGSVRISVDNSNDVQIKVQDINSGSSDIFITVQHFV
jgi:hypothetical protein